jgi:hypothetical protein
MFTDGQQSYQELTQEQRLTIKKNLRPVIDSLAGGVTVEIVVPNYDFGRALATGNNPLLKESVDETSGDNNSTIITFDFSKLRDVDTVLREGVAEIPDESDLLDASRCYDWKPQHRGVIIALIAPEMIPKNSQADLSAIGKIAKHATTAFITKEGRNYEDMNRRIFAALGANVDYTGKAVRK